MPEITRKEVYKIKPFRHITVGDPWYMENERYCDRTDLVFDETARCCNVGAVVVSRIYDRDEEYDFDCSSIRFSIILAKDERQLNVYLEDRRYRNTVKKEMELGCDTAQFEISVVNKKGECRSLDFDTGADGFFGYAAKYKEYYGMRIDLEIDEDMTTFDQVVDNMSYLFGFDKDRDLFMYEENTEEMEME